jgi:glycosyltransferase involved in cell wall biosynthesis
VENKKKILFVVDTRNWAYDDRAKTWRELLKNEYNIDILYLEDYVSLKPSYSFNRLLKEYQNAALNSEVVSLKDLTKYKKLFSTIGNVPAGPIFDHKKYDGIYIFYHRALCDVRLLSTPIPFEKLAIAINNEKWTTDGAKKTYNTYLKGVRAISCSNDFILRNFENFHPNVFKVTQVVNPDIFKMQRNSCVTPRRGRQVIVGWSGNYTNKIKNFHLVVNACKRSKVRLLKARDLKRQELSKWYNKLDMVICASKSEGGPSLILEAGACAIPVITTPVGLSREIVLHEKTGLITDWDEVAISDSINILANDRTLRARIAKSLHKRILNQWTYEKRVHEIRSMLKEITT